MDGSKSRLKNQSLLSTTSRLQIRRKSFGYGSVPGLESILIKIWVGELMEVVSIHLGKPVERNSQLGIEFKRPPMVYLPTYQIDSRHPFEVEYVTGLVKSTVDTMFGVHKYNPTETPALSMKIAGEVMRKVKHECYNRYRILAVCTLGQKRAQSYNNAVAFIWDGERDKYVDVHAETRTCLCQVTVFGVYLD